MNLLSNKLAFEDQVIELLNAVSPENRSMADHQFPDLPRAPLKADSFITVRDLVFVLSHFNQMEQAAREGHEQSGKPET